MNSGWAAAIVAAVTLGGGIIFNAGQIAAVLKELRNISKDHEHRIRLLEGSRHAAGDRQ